MKKVKIIKNYFTTILLLLTKYISQRATLKNNAKPLETFIFFCDPKNPIKNGLLYSASVKITQQRYVYFKYINVMFKLFKIQWSIIIVIFQDNIIIVNTVNMQAENKKLK